MLRERGGGQEGGVCAVQGAGGLEGGLNVGERRGGGQEGGLSEGSGELPGAE